MRISKLSPDQRRKAVLEALSGKKPVKNLAVDYGVYPGSLYYWMEKATEDAEEQLEEAKKEVAFRKKVLKLMEEATP